MRIKWIYCLSLSRKYSGSITSYAVRYVGIMDGCVVYLPHVRILESTSICCTVDIKKAIVLTTYLFKMCLKLLMAGSLILILLYESWRQPRHVLGNVLINSRISTFTLSVLSFNSINKELSRTCLISTTSLFPI